MSIFNKINFMAKKKITEEKVEAIADAIADAISDAISDETTVEETKTEETPTQEVSQAGHFSRDFGKGRK
jgi:hypothetical protein